MHRNFVIFSIFILLMMPHARASEQIYSQESIFNDVSVISAESVKNMIADSLIDELQSDRIIVELRNYKKGLQIKTKKEFFDVDIVESDFNKRTRRFKYKLKFSSDDFSEVYDVTGSYDEIVSIPTMSVRIPNGTVIKAEDVEYVDIAKHKLRHDTILDKSQLIGKTLKHSKSALRPIRMRDVQQEQLVKRSDNIDIIYETPSITLTAKGIAIDGGAKGDVIRVRNTSSNKIVRAIVKDSSLAIVKNGKL